MYLHWSPGYTHWSQQLAAVPPRSAAAMVGPGNTHMMHAMEQDLCQGLVTCAAQLQLMVVSVKLNPVKCSPLHYTCACSVLHRSTELML